MFGFEKLEVWQRAIAFADTVHAVTRNLPSDERFGLANQMRRAAVSASSKLAESSARISKKDFARFVEIATGSLHEVVWQGLLSHGESECLYAVAEEQGRMLGGLRRSLLESA